MLTTEHGTPSTEGRAPNTIAFPAARPTINGMNDPVFFGGTFDPVHHGHLIVARAVAEQLRTPVVLLPTRRPAHKSPPVASAEDRVAMVRLAIQGEKGLEASEIELDLPEPSYTLHTLREIRRRMGQAGRLRWIIGADMLEYLPKWHCIGEVLSLADLIVVDRPGRPQTAQVLAGFANGELPDDQISRLRQNAVEAPSIEISSTQIRGRIADGLSIRYLCPEAVVEYMAAKGLYATP